MAFSKNVTETKKPAAVKKAVTKAAPAVNNSAAETVDTSARADIAACKKEVADLAAELEALKTKLSSCASGASGTGLGKKFVQMMDKLK